MMGFKKIIRRTINAPQRRENNNNKFKSGRAKKFCNQNHINEAGE